MNILLKLIVFLFFAKSIWNFLVPIWLLFRHKNDMSVSMLLQLDIFLIVASLGMSWYLNSWVHILYSFVFWLMSLTFLIFFPKCR